MRTRRVTRELAGIPDVEHGEGRSASVAIADVFVIHTSDDEVEMRVDGRSLRVTVAQAWAIAAALLELGRLARASS